MYIQLTCSFFSSTTLWIWIFSHDFSTQTDKIMCGANNVAQRDLAPGDTRKANIHMFYLHYISMIRKQMKKWKRRIEGNHSSDVHMLKYAIGSVQRAVPREVPRVVPRAGPACGPSGGSSRRPLGRARWPTVECINGERHTCATPWPKQKIWPPRALGEKSALSTLPPRKIFAPLNGKKNKHMYGEQPQV